MPVKRRDMAISQYLSVAIASFIGIPIYVVISGISAIVNESAYFTFMTLFTGMAPFLAIPFILAGLVYPLFCIKSLEDKQDGLFPLFMLASFAIPQFVVWGAGRLGWSVDIALVVTLAVAIIIFVLSYFITRKLYAKIDF